MFYKPIEAYAARGQMFLIVDCCRCYDIIPMHTAESTHTCTRNKTGVIMDARDQTGTAGRGGRGGVCRGSPGCRCLFVSLAALPALLPFVISDDCAAACIADVGMLAACLQAAA